MRDKLITEFSRIYWKELKDRDRPMTHEMADAAIAIFKQEKAK
jgi:hypothetical protein